MNERGTASLNMKCICKSLGTRGYEKNDEESTAEEGRSFFDIKRQLNEGKLLQNKYLYY